MHWLGRIIFGIAGLLFLLTGLWLVDTSEIIVQMGGALSGLVGAALIVLAFGTRADWKRWVDPAASPFKNSKKNSKQSLKKVQSE